MYSDLLEASWRAQEESEATPLDGEHFDASFRRRLLDEVLDRRRECAEHTRAFGVRIGNSADAPADIARHLAYDLALIRLCVAHGIACDVRRFTRPLPERRRLEDALEAKGVVLRDRRSRVAGSD